MLIIILSLHSKHYLQILLRKCPWGYFFVHHLKVKYTSPCDYLLSQKTKHGNAKEKLR